jgi:hypothetical protein
MSLKLYDEMEFFRYKVCKKCYKLKYQKGFIQCGNKDLCKCKNKEK